MKVKKDDFVDRVVETMQTGSISGFKISKHKIFDQIKTVQYTQNGTTIISGNMPANFSIIKEINLNTYIGTITAI